jgi:hypothetical protein
MIIVDEKLLDRDFRGRHTCGLCGKTRTCEPEHWKCRGLGGGSRLDISINLLAVDRECHTKVHAGSISKEAVQKEIAGREGLTMSEIEDTVWHFLRLSKGTTRNQLMELGLEQYVSPTAKIAL